jgi:hypothetical protein
MVKNNLKLSLLFAFFGAVATLLLIWVQGSSLAEVLEGQENAPSVLVLSIISIVQQVILTFIASLIGLSLIRKVNLEVPFFRSLVDRNYSFQWDKKWIVYAAIGGSLGSLLMVVLDKFIFLPLLPTFEETTAPVSWGKSFLMSVVYGGIWEEILMRLFLMTLIIWIVSKLFRKQADNIPNWMYWTGIIVATLLFGAGHLPATAQLFGELNTALVSRALLLNGIVGVFFGYLFWKKGLVYAMIAHMFFHIANYTIWMHIFN